MNPRVLRAVPLSALLACSLAASLLSARAPDRLVLADAWCAPTWGRPLGCGDAGVDLTALVSAAILRGVVLAASVAAVGFAIGTPLGAGAALVRGARERFVERACDLVQAFPTFLLAFAVLSAIRAPGRLHLGFVFALTAWAPFARLALSQTRVLRDAAFIEAAYALGLRTPRVLWVHVVPNLLGVVAVQLGSTAAAVVVSEAALSFLGFGPKDGVSLGNVLDQGVAAMLRAPHVLLVGSVAVFLTSSTLLLAGRAIRREG